MIALCDAVTTVAGDPWRGCSMFRGHEGPHEYGRRVWLAYPEYGIAAGADHRSHDSEERP